MHEATDICTGFIWFRICLWCDLPFRAAYGSEYQSLTNLHADRGPLSASVRCKWCYMALTDEARRFIKDRKVVFEVSRLTRITFTVSWFNATAWVICEYDCRICQGALLYILSWSKADFSGLFLSAQRRITFRQHKRQDTYTYVSIVSSRGLQKLS